MIIREVSYARAGLVGNPSDIFHGKTIALLFDRFAAQVTLYETPTIRIIPNGRDLSQFDSLADLVHYRRQYGYYGGIRIIEAAIVRFVSYCADHGIRLADRNFSVEYDSTIPFAVGLGGSAAIIHSALAALMRFHGLTKREIPKPEQPNIMLEAETQELDIAAGPQDRVVMAYGGVVDMDFTQEAYARNNNRYGDYTKLDPSLLPPLFIAYSQALSKSSGRAHNVMRYRVNVEHDARVTEVMSAKARLVDGVRALLLAGRGSEIGPLLSQDFELRKSVYTITPENQQMIDIARAHGSHANYAGSGGAVIGLCGNQADFRTLEKAYGEAGFSAFRVKPIDYQE